MKKVILSIALIAGVFAMTGLNTANAAEQPSIIITLEDDGFVDVKLEDLNEAVQNAIQEISATYDVKSIKYNNEKKITKVTASKKEDQSQKVFILDDEGKEVKKETHTPEL
ncbi:MAG: hypothetical protein PHV53_08960 [Fermentimonas sp.]|nr:hypothetical protein [Fermentimonas sp.]